MIRPLKKKRGPLEPKVPQYIAEQADADGADAYSALRRLSALPLWERGDGPLFSTAESQPMTTARFRALVKRYASALGYDPKTFGAHSARIGGATDVANSDEYSEVLLEAKGRWGSDIGKIYARMTRRTHLRASAAMYRTKGRDVEEIVPSFVQPA